jgi:hypothetical protein
MNSWYLLGLLLQDPRDGPVVLWPQYLQVYWPLCRAMYWCTSKGLALHDPPEAPLDVCPQNLHKYPDEPSSI